jgi:hypothetical protein
MTNPHPSQSLATKPVCRGAKRRASAWPDPERARRIGDVILGAVVVVTCLAGLAMILIGAWQN